MKKWNAPELTELNINETAHDALFGNHPDGGYFGDFHVGTTTYNINNCTGDRAGHENHGKKPDFQS